MLANSHWTIDGRSTSCHLRPLTVQGQPVRVFETRVYTCSVFSRPFAFSKRIDAGRLADPGEVL